MAVYLGLHCPKLTKEDGVIANSVSQRRPVTQRRWQSMLRHRSSIQQPWKYGSRTQSTPLPTERGYFLSPGPAAFSTSLTWYRWCFLSLCVDGCNSSCCEKHLVDNKYENIWGIHLPDYGNSGSLVSQVNDTIIRKGCAGQTISNSTFIPGRPCSFSDADSYQPASPLLILDHGHPVDRQSLIERMQVMLTELPPNRWVRFASHNLTFSAYYAATMTSI